MFQSTAVQRISSVSLGFLFLLPLTACEQQPGTQITARPTATNTPQPAATAIPKTVAATTVPKILWDAREAYEKEGQVVLFTDCGLYKGDTDELTGAKCEFKGGEWVLIEPQFEPADNLLIEADLIESATDEANLKNDSQEVQKYRFGRRWELALKPGNKCNIRKENSQPHKSKVLHINIQSCSTDQFVRFLNVLPVTISETLNGRYTTFVTVYRGESDNIDDLRLRVADRKPGSYYDVTEKPLITTRGKWRTLSVTKLIAKDSERVFVDIVYTGKSACKFSISDLFLVRGFFPMT